VPLYESFGWRYLLLINLLIYNCLELVRGNEPDQPDANGVVSVITPALRRQIRSRTTRHTFAREALPKSLDRSELIKVYGLKLANEIWARLHTEYGNITEILYSKSELKIHSLRKEATISISDHINEFTRLKSMSFTSDRPDVDKMRVQTVNLAFLRSLGKPLQTFHQAMENESVQ